MGMRLPSPPHLDKAEKTLAQSFWVLVAFSLAVITAFVVTASINPIEAPVFGVALVVLAVLWAVHALDVRAHRAELLRDPDFKHARERRGF